MLIEILDKLDKNVICQNAIRKDKIDGKNEIAATLKCIQRKG